jgi:hypothetical protein
MPPRRDTFPPTWLHHSLWPPHLHMGVPRSVSLGSPHVAQVSACPSVSEASPVAQSLSLLREQRPVMPWKGRVQVGARCLYQGTPA